MPLPTIPLLPIMLGLGLGIAVILFLVNRPQLEYPQEPKTTYSPPVLVRPRVTTIRRRRPNGRELTTQQSTETSSEKKPETCKSAKTSTEEKPDTCAICLESLTHSLKTLPCTHIFHEPCLKKCFSESLIKICPLCRRKVNPAFNSYY